MMVKKDFEEIFKKYSGFIFQYAYKFLKDKNLAEDVVSETFIKFFRFYSAIKDKAILKWLIITAKNVMIDILRAKEKSLSLEDFKIPDNKNNPEEIFFLKRDLEKLNEIVRKLPSSLYEIYQLYYEEDYPVKEIAQRKNLSVSAVNKKLFKIRRFIFKRLPKEIKIKYFKKGGEDG
jgi:RNA polymerase sigma-70 factor (ECF subfamily)